MKIVDLMIQINGLKVRKRDIWDSLKRAYDNGEPGFSFMTKDTVIENANLESMLEQYGNPIDGSKLNQMNMELNLGVYFYII